MAWRRLLLVAVLLAGTVGTYAVASKVVNRRSAKAPPLKEKRAEVKPSSEEQEVCQYQRDLVKDGFAVLVNQLWIDDKGNMTSGLAWQGVDGKWQECRTFQVP